MIFKEYASKEYVKEYVDNLTAEDVGAMPANTEVPSIEGLATTEYVMVSDATVLEEAKAYTDSKQIAGEVETSVTVNRDEYVVCPDAVQNPLGLKVKVSFLNKGFYFFKAPTKAPVEDMSAWFLKSNGEREWGLYTHTQEDFLSARATFIAGDLSTVCPTFKYNHPGFTDIAYFYEETHDNLGMGMTIQPGLYAINSQTFAYEPLNLEDDPVLAVNIYNLQGSEDSINFFKECFLLKKEMEFTVRDKNLITDGANTVVFFCDASGFSALDSVDPFDAMIIYSLIAFVIGPHPEDNTTIIGLTKDYSGLEKTTVYYNVTKTVDPKHLPDGGVGYTELGKVISWDGDTTGKLVLKDAFIQVSKTPTDLSQVESVSSMVLVDLGEEIQSGTEQVLPFSEMVYQQLDEYTDVLMADDSVIIGSCTKEHYVDAFDVNVPTGTYFAFSEAAYVSRLIMKETIHTIDPKYLPLELFYGFVSDGELYGAIGGLREDFNSDIEEVREELENQMSNIDSFKQEINQNIDTFKQEVNQNFDSFKQDINYSVDSFRTDNDSFKQDINYNFDLFKQDTLNEIDNKISTDISAHNESVDAHSNMGWLSSLSGYETPYHSGYIGTLIKPDGHEIYPRTYAESVSMENGNSLETEMNNIVSILQETVASVKTINLDNYYLQITEDDRYLSYREILSELILNNINQNITTTSIEISQDGDLFKDITNDPSPQLNNLAMTWVDDAFVVINNIAIIKTNNEVTTISFNISLFETNIQKFINVHAAILINQINVAVNVL